MAKTRTTPYHPQLDGFIEKFNCTLLSLLSMAASENECNWSLHLPLVMMAYRMECAGINWVHIFYLIFGSESRNSADLSFDLPPPIHANQYALAGSSDTPGDCLSTGTGPLGAAPKSLERPV